MMPSSSLRILIALGLCAAVQAALAGCGRRHARPPEPPPVCAARLPEHLQHTTPEQLPPSTWYSLFFKGYRDGIPDYPVDCLGEPIEWTELPSGCADQEPKATALPREPLKDETLVVRHAGGDYWYGWVPFRRFDNGMAEGPIAVARVHDGRLEFRAAGTLRAYATRPRFEVRRLGTEHLLTAEGERCSSDNPNDCERATRLMWLDRQRFRMRPLMSSTVRKCLGPAWFPATERIERKISDRWRRELVRNVALAYEEDHISVDEHIVVNDRDLDQPNLPARLFREAQAKIVIRVQGGELLAEGQSSWTSIRQEDGSTRLEGSDAVPE